MRSICSLTTVNRMAEWGDHVSAPRRRIITTDFAVHFAQRQSPGPRPPLVIEEVSGIGKFSRKTFENVQAGVRACQFPDSLPVTAIKAIDIEPHNLF